MIQKILGNIGNQSQTFPNDLKCIKNILAISAMKIFHHKNKSKYYKIYTQWSDSNFIPMDSKKFEFRNFDYIIRFAMKNESGIEKFRSRDQRIFEENRFYEIKTLTHNHVNTISDKRNWTGSSDSTCNLVLLTEVS